MLELPIIIGKITKIQVSNVKELFNCELGPGKFIHDLQISKPNKCFPKSLPQYSNIVPRKDITEAEHGQAKRLHKPRRPQF